MTSFFLIESQQDIVNADGEYLKIRPQSFQVFSFLLDHENTVVSKDQLFDNVWASLTVTDDSITQCVADIRRILGKKHRHLLQTIPKKGYRLSAGGNADGSRVIKKTNLPPALASDSGETESPVSGSEKYNPTSENTLCDPLHAASSDPVFNVADVTAVKQVDVDIPNLTDKSTSPSSIVESHPAGVNVRVANNTPFVVTIDVKAPDSKATLASKARDQIDELPEAETLSQTDAPARKSHDRAAQAKPSIGLWRVKLTRNRWLWVFGSLICVITVGSLTMVSSTTSLFPGSSAIHSDFPLNNQSAVLPSIAVLPFQNLSGVISDNYLSDGTTEDLITDLSTLSGLLVIARNSVSAYKDKQIDMQSVAQDLNIRYILSGSVRRSGSRIRINVELTDTQNSTSVWADRYDGELDTIFDMQDKINQSIVSALALELTLSEKQRLSKRSTENLQAYDLYQQGRFYTFSNQRELGHEYFRKAALLDPGFAGAYAALAYSHSVAVSFGQSKDVDSELNTAFRLATKAASMDQHSAEAHVALGQIFLLRGQHEEALRSTGRAVASNPSYAPAHGIDGWVKTLSGNYSAALDAFGRAIRLQPTSNGVILSVQGAAYYLAGRYDEAAAILEESNAINPNIVTAHAFLAATYQRLGRSDESEWEAQEVTVLSPNFKISDWLWVKNFKNKDSLEYLQLLKDLQTSGLSLK